MNIQALILYYLQGVPEIILLLGACVVLLTGAFCATRVNLIFIVSVIVLLLTTYFTFYHLTGSIQTWFGGFYIVDNLAVLTKSTLCLLTLLVLFYSRRVVVQSDMPCGEFHALMLFALLGMMLIASAGNLLSIYLGLELLSLSLYALVAIQKDDSLGSEAAIKYFVLGAIASGCLLYGISLLYGVSGTLFLHELAGATQGEIGIGLITAIIFIVVGVAFKFGAVPFHMWLPDVYQGAPLPVTTLIASAAKVAGFMLAIRLLVSGLQFGHEYWQQMLLVLAVLSLIAGNVIAIAQTDLRRMLAYSTIGHVGYILLGLMVATPQGYAAALFYTLIYALMSSAVFGVLLCAQRLEINITQLDDLQGLSKRAPWLAFLVLLLMFSMAGIPLTIGFYAKLNILQVVVDSGAVVAAVIAVITSVIGAFYYLRVIKLMYFDDSEAAAATGAMPWLQISVLSVHTISVVLLFLFPQFILTLCAQAFGY